MVETIQQASKHEIPKSVNDCVKPDPISVTLWEWSERVAKWGRALMVIIVVFGVIEGFVMSADNYSDRVPIFIASVIRALISALITYLSYNVLSLLIASLASIVQNTRSHALLKEYELRSEDYVASVTGSEAKINAAASKPTSAFRRAFPIAEWTCHKCGRKNAATTDTCALCNTAYVPRTKEEIQAEEADEKWSCPKCGRKNSERTDVCTLCGQKRG
ncbi:MAG: hypothetical protein IKW04_04500 [Clostridia bacterium]|nr:hypothetical protein [Clostridia bacterium]